MNPTLKKWSNPNGYAIMPSYRSLIRMETKDPAKEVAVAFKTDAAKDAGRDERFTDLERRIREALAKQNSDLALSVMTLGALALGSSDIHYDAHEQDISVRMRIDGRLATIFTLSHKEYKLVLERIKYKAELKINISHIPQDGKYRIIENAERIDIRVSTLPTPYGEAVVCRVLDSGKSIPPVEELGFMWTAKRQIDKVTQKKNGMILVTGPTGSGKTTTLYSLLSGLNISERKIITLEDPIEYELPGVVQSEVREKDGYTYENGLKAVLRQDPDVVMIGEIRGLETATIATQASLTGHLVLSTLHTKNALETVERLMNIGLAPYILASAVDMIIAQRLVRRVCEHCRTSEPANANQNAIIRTIMGNIGMQAVEKATREGFTLYRGTGCEHCGGTGYKGRMGVYEVLVFSDEVRDAIRAGSSPRAILDIARKQDLVLMQEDGVLKAMRGKTSFEEVFGVLEM
jgi:type II secretory ATPase GspE/PulE/Tfp pilus assembly ATPase PilB-like protein